MDFAELEAVEGLRWPWNAWPSSRSAAAALVVPLSVICTPLMPLADLPFLLYEPLSCSRCRAALNPYARVDYRSAIWICPFCHQKNPFPRSYAGIADQNLPVELFPTHSTVEYLLPYKNFNPNPSGVLHNSFSSSSLFTSLTSSLSSASVSAPSLAAVQAPGPAFVFVVDVCSAEEELRALKNEILHVVAHLPENALVGLVSFGSMVWVHDLGYAECSRVMLFCGDRELSSVKIQEQLAGVSHFENQKPAATWQPLQKQGFLLPVSECEFNFCTAVEELSKMSDVLRGRRPLRATGAAISTSIALLESCCPNSGGRVMVFTSGLATTGPGMVAEIDHSKAIRTQRDIINGNAPLHGKACNFYKKLAQRLLDRSFVLDLFACSLDQVGAAEMRFPIEISGGLLILAESFQSEQFNKCLRHIFKLEEGTCQPDMNFDATIELVTTKEVQICGALGPCMSLRTKNSSVCEKEIGEGGTSSWKTSTLTSKTSIAFIFQIGASHQNNDPGPVFFIQFKTRYLHANGSIRLRVTTAARRWVSTARSLEVSAGFDQEAAATIMARLAVSRSEDYNASDVIRWLDKMLIRFTSKFGDYVPEDSSSFRLPPGFSMYPQFMYYLRRSQFMDIFNYTPDETAFFKLALNREGVVGSLIMTQPTLFRYCFDGPPMPVLLDINSVSPDVILLFDSYFHVVIHYGSKIAELRKLGFDKKDENLRKLLEAAEMDAGELIEGRIPVPKLIKCDQHGSQARFLLARLNPSVTHKTRVVDGSEVLFTDDVSLQDFVEHLQSLAVEG